MALGFSAGALRTQALISPAAASPGETCDSHQKATVRFPKQKQSKHSLISPFGISADAMWLN